MATDVSIVGRDGGAGLRLSLRGSCVGVVDGSGRRTALARLDAALIALLTLGGEASRHQLVAMLFPAQEPAAARNALRQRLFRLRRAVGAELVAGGERLSLVTGVRNDLLDDDAGGELLADLNYDDCPRFDEWLSMQRATLRESRRRRVGERLDSLERDRLFADAATLAEKMLADEPLDEATVRRLMTLHHLAGQSAAAIQVYERFAATLAANLDSAPARATTDLLATIRHARAPATAALREVPLSVRRPPRLIGRDAQLAELHDAWSDGTAFWLLGEAGLGKSRLLEEFVAQADAAQSRTALAVAARPGDAGVPYAVLGRALRSLIARSPSLLDGMARSEIARVLPEITSAPAIRPALVAPLMLQAAIEALLSAALARGLVALLIDDLHFADAASIEMLQALALADSLAGLRWGFAQRPAEGDAAVETLRAALEESQRVRLLTLAPLDQNGLAEMVRSFGIKQLDAVQLAPLLVRHTGGNPMYALETIKQILVDGRQVLDARLPHPPGVAQLIERRLRQLSNGAVALARVAAVAGVDFSTDLAERVLGARALVLADDWRELEAAHVLRGLDFAHDLVCEAVLAGLPLPIAEPMHAAVAGILEAGGGEPARVAAHWLDAQQPQRALAALHAAAEAARRTMRRKEEAAFLSRAARIESEAGLRDVAFDTWRTAIEALWVSDRGSLDAASYDRLDAWATTDRQRGIAHALRATWAHETGDVQGAIRLCRAAIELADGAGDEATTVDARQRLAQILHFNGDFAGAVSLMQQLQPWFGGDRASDADKLVYYGELAIVLDNDDRGREARPYHQHAVDIGRRLGAWSDVVSVLGNLAVSWATAGYMQRAVELLQEALQLAAAHDDARGCAATLPIEMHNELRDCGRFADALHWVEPALTAVNGQLSVWRPLVQCHVACTWMALGQHARAQREIDAAQRADCPDWMRAKALQMRARLMLALGRSAKALLEQSRAAMPSDGRRVLRASIMLDHALALEPADALAAARAVVAQAERLDLSGMVLAGHIRAARFAVDAGLAADAAAHAQAALAFDADVAPSDLYRAELWLNAWRALQWAGSASASLDALRSGADWLADTLHDQVPEAFRDSFIRANPVNQQLLRAAAREGVAVAR